MEDNRGYNKRPRSYTEFRTSYSDSKNNFSSTDKQFRKQALLKYIIIAVFLAVVAVAGFLITDALLNISEEPYVAEETTTKEGKTDIDKKYFESQVTIPAEKVSETDASGDNNDNVRD